MDIPKVNGRNWLAKGLLQVVIILALGTYIAVEKITRKPDVKEEYVSAMVEDINDTVNINSGRIMRLETLMESLRTIPESVASMRSTVDGVKSTVDKIEKKLDAHIDK